MSLFNPPPLLCVLYLHTDDEFHLTAKDHCSTMPNTWFLHQVSLFIDHSGSSSHGAFG